MTTTPTAPIVRGHYDPATFSVQYVVADPATGKCAIIDPVLDFDPNSGKVTTENADALLGIVAREGWTVEWILDTHPHADHFSSAIYLQQKTGAPRAIGEKVVEVQKIWKEIYHLPDFEVGTGFWDHTFADGETFKIGEMDARVIYSPGHTIASITYVVGDAAFVHDTLFQPDFGTARADFPGGDAGMLYRSIMEILALPDETRLFTGHDYQPGGRDVAWESTVARQKAENPHLKQAPTEADYVALRTKRDAELPLPKLMLAALQVNMRGGRLPDVEENGRSYLKIPVNAF
ncbi:MBL fold metallo-hydrolase [Amorphus sp. 3PC139-8]|uniref:MBL fold metallo-hydrolase n=1 Tax=Amorphus sp. 3PC139-8 TaxID=2735676 RepID=UPI00345D6C50